MIKKMLFYIAGGTLLLSSCGKSGNSTTVQPIATTSIQQKLLGRWKATFEADDQNNNGLLDSNEMQSLDTSMSDLYLFSSGGTGTITSKDNGGTVIDNLTWAFNTDSTILNLVDVTHFNETYYGKLHTLTATHLTLADTLTNGMSVKWFGYVKVP